MADGALMELLRLLDDMEEPVEAQQPRHRQNPNRSANNVVPPRSPTTTKEKQSSSVSFDNSGSQNLTGLINNTGYTKGNGNGSIFFGSFDASTNYRSRN